MYIYIYPFSFFKSTFLDMWTVLDINFNLSYVI